MKNLGYKACFQGIMFPTHSPAFRTNSDLAHYNSHQFNCNAGIS